MDSSQNFEMKSESDTENKAEESADPLDIEYRSYLSTIRGLISKVNTNFCLNQYRFWLEKISAVSGEQKALRNQYLLELAKQIENKVLKYPFTESPPEGDLVPFFDRPFSPTKCGSSLKALKKDLFAKEVLKEETEFLENSDNESWVDLTSEESNVSLKKTRNIIKRKKAQGKVFENNNEPCTSNNIDSLKVDNVSDNTTNSMEKKDINGINIKPITQSSQKLESNKLITVQESSSFMRADWKSIIDSLQQRLTDTLQENTELKKHVNLLRQQKIEDEKRFQENLKKCNENCKKSIIEMEIKHAAEIKNLQSTFNTEMEHMEEVYRREIADFENKSTLKVNNVKSEFEKLIQEKEAEIKRLNELVDNKCSKISDEISGLTNHINEIMDHTSNDDRIIFLQKCVTKMDKLFQKAEKEHIKEIQKLQHELSLKDKISSIKLQTLKAEMITKTSNEKQIQFDGLVNNLEMRYKKFLDIQEIQLAEVRKHYELKISKLLNLLNINDIYYNPEEFQ